VNYPIATRSRRYFNFEEAKQHTANVLFSKVSEEAAKQQAIGTTKNIIYSRINRETERVEEAKENFVVTDHAYIHVPIYHIQFTVGGGKTYEAALDASNGRVIYTEIPRTTGFKLKALGSAAFWFILTIIGAAIAFLSYQGIHLISGLDLFYPAIGFATISGILGILTLYYVTRGVTAERAR